MPFLQLCEAVFYHSKIPLLVLFFETGPHVAQAVRSLRTKNCQVYAVTVRVSEHSGFCRKASPTSNPKPYLEAASLLRARGVSPRYGLCLLP